MTKGPRRPRAVLALLCVAQFIDVLGVTVAVVALPAIARDLGAGQAEAGWVVSGYALSFGGLLLPAGRLADRVGRRRMFAGGLVAFAASSLACGLAGSTPALVAARVAQGAAAAAVVPAALALLTAAFTEARARTRALAVWTAAAAGGGAAGFLLGGVITGTAGWRWVFLLNVPIALTSAACALRLLKESRGARRRPQLWRVLRPAAAPAAVAALLTATTSGAAVLVTTHLQDVLGRSATAAGMAFLPFSVLVAVASLTGPRVVARFGRRATIILGLATIAAGMTVFTRLPAHGGEAAVLAGLAISGAGLGWASVATTAAGMAATADVDHGVIAGILNTATQIGTAAGVALLGAVAASAGGAAAPAGMRVGWLVAAALAGAGALAVALSPLCARRRARTRRRTSGRRRTRCSPRA